MVLRGRDPARRRHRHPQARRLGRGRRNRGLNNSAEAPGSRVRRHGDARRGRARPGEPRQRRVLVPLPRGEHGPRRAVGQGDVRHLPLRDARLPVLQTRERQ